MGNGVLVEEMLSSCKSEKSKNVFVNSQRNWASKI